jgi:hypothetical protein
MTAITLPNYKRVPELLASAKDALVTRLTAQIKKAPAKPTTFKPKRAPRLRNAEATKDRASRKADAAIAVIGSKEIRRILVALGVGEYMVAFKPTDSESTIWTIITREQARTEKVFTTRRFEFGPLTTSKKYIRITRLE